MSGTRGPFHTLYAAYRWLRRTAKRVLMALVPVRRLWAAPPFMRDKQALVDYACRKLGTRSMADLGGACFVHGEYTLRALRKGWLERAVIADFYMPGELLERSRRYPRLTVIKGDFTDREVAERIGQVDAIALFDVLLHQVDPSWEDVFELYAPRTRCFLVFNPQWVRTGRTTRLVDLGRDEFMLNVPHPTQDQICSTIFERMNEIQPETGKPYRDY